MKRLLTIALSAFAMLLVAALAAMFSLRVAIHGREVAVPALAGLSDEEAASATRKLGLNLSVENRFFSASIPANHVLSQAPPPRERVRRGWQVRVTESLGAQHVTAPDLTGENERPAGLMLRRLQLKLAPNAHLPMPGPEDRVVAQSPQPNSTGATEPRVALLVSAPQPEAAAPAYVMPRIVGLSVRSATTLLAGAGLHLGSMAYIDPSPDGETASSGGATPAAAAGPAEQDSAVGNDAAPRSGMASPEAAKQSSAAGQSPAHSESAVGMADLIVTQFPTAGSRLTDADEIRVGVTRDHPAAASVSLH